jgi:hypothetical protein
VKIYSRLAVLVLSSVTLLGTAVRAQAPAAAAKKVYTHKTDFRLPIQIDARDRDGLDKIQLWMKTGANDIWALKATVPATEDKFTYHVDHDGDYWFNVVTVDKNGVSRPPDLTREPPGLIVCVDTQPPQIEARAITLTDGSPGLKCMVKDAHPDDSSLRVEYKGDFGVWVQLQPMPETSGLYRIPERTPHGTVRVSASDLAKNNATRQFTPWSMPNAGGSALETVSGPTLFDTQSNKPNTQSPMPLAHGPVTPVAAVTTDYNHNPTRVSDMVTNGRSLQLINSVHASLDYQIDEAGPSGIGRVEVWFTKDEGQSWQKLCDDPDCHSPADIDLPGDGLYGVSLVVSNGNGVAGTPPAHGDRPNWWIEVDTTKPEAQILDIHATSEDPGAFLISWEASDKNMKPDPIDLYYCTQRGGAWMPIARGLPNNGHYRWSVPRNAGTEFYIRMEVTDRAGNVARVEGKHPVYLDLQHPKAHVLGVSTATRQ